jgi:23S rRNA pseudouridine2604 synthase
MGSRKTADFFAREAKKLGYAARSALKLTEIQDRFRVMRKGDVVLDLGCHPGAWTQVSSERVSVNGAVLGVDLTATRADALGPRVDPKRTTLATGDVFDLDPAKLRAMASSGPGTSSGKSGSMSSGRPFASVLSDMAPSTSGDGVRDAALSYELAEQAVRLALGDGALAVLDDDDDDGNGDDDEENFKAENFATDPGVLRKGGSLVVKLLEGPGGGRENLQKVCKPQFDNVKWFRPKATRRESKEVFLIATGRRTFASFTERASGSNDDDRETDTPAAGPQRVSKILAMRDLCSRREAEALIDTGEVSVNGEVVVLGTKADPASEVRVTGPVLRRHQSKRTTALNKPGGYVSNLPADGEVEASALLRLSDETGDVVDRPRLSVCGRLDKHSRGLLVLTEDGTLARDIIAGDSVAKTYLVEVARAVTREDLRRLNGPLDFGADEDVSLKPIRVRRLAPTLLEFVLREGKNRQIRRVCDGIGLHVVDLLRVRMGKSDLGSLPEGSWRTMSKLETDEFKAP